MCRRAGHPGVRRYLLFEKKSIDRAGNRNARVARLTPIQRQFFDRALAELRKQGVDTGECELAYDGICALGSELAAQMLLVIQNRYQKWMDDETVQVRSTLGARRSLAGLVDKLLPLAKEQVLVLRERDRHRYTEDRAPIVIIRLTEWLQKRLAGLARLVREQKLQLLPPEHAWAIHHVFAADSYANAESTLCISANELWVECTRKSFWHDNLTETSWTEKLPLHAVIPVDFLSSKGIDLPAVLPRTAARPYRKRLQLLEDAENVFDLLNASLYEMERAVPDERLALAERIWFGKQGPFVAARNASQSIEQEMDRWEAALEAKKQELCREILKIDIGDVAVMPAGKGVLRIRVESMTVHTGDGSVMFIVNGTRFRKDGSLGKLHEALYIRLEDEQRPG